MQQKAKRQKIKTKKILIITTNDISYLGADTAGQQHLKYSEDALIIRVPDPVIFPPDFYVRTLEKGFGGIIVASAGDESPFLNSHARLAKNIDAAYKIMNEKGIDTKRLVLTAICSICAGSFIKAVNNMTVYLDSVYEQE